MHTSTKTRYTLSGLSVIALAFLLQHPAMAAVPAHTSTSESILSMLPMLVIFGGIFYFMLIRPQNNRAKAHQSLIDGLTKGDEVTTSGGLVGTIVKLKDDFLIINIASDTDILVQRQNILGALPKGTIKSCGIRTSAPNRSGKKNTLKQVTNRAANQEKNKDT